jgi:hypothetical protein
MVTGATVGASVGVAGAVALAASVGLAVELGAGEGASVTGRDVQAARKMQSTDERSEIFFISFSYSVRRIIN